MSIVAHQGGLTGLAYAAEGAAIVSSGYDGALRVWDSANGASLTEAAETGGWITLLTPGARGNRFAWEAEGAVQVGQLGPDHRLLSRAVPGELLLPSALVLSPDAESVLVADSTSIKWLATRSGDVLNAWPERGVTLLATSPDGGRVAFATADSQLWLGDPVSRRGESLAPVSSALRSLVFSPDGRRVGLGDDSGNVAVLDSANGQKLFEVSGHAGAVLALAFSPDGRTLATAGEDGEIRLSDPMIGSQRGRFQARTNVRYLAFAPDSQALACGGDDGVILVWAAARPSPPSETAQPIQSADSAADPGSSAEP